ncbi:hypothetical protein YB2330_003784 [Saitoella coloradoensis]
MKISSRTFVISGGSSGLGRASVEILLAHGAYVAVLDLNPGEGLIEASSGKAKFWKVDVTKTSDIEKAVAGVMQWTKETEAELGGIVCCAGVASAAKIIDKDNKPLDITAFNRVLQINVTGTIDLIRLFLPHITTNQGSDPDGERGVIITVSSAAAFDGQPGQLAYSASKGAIRSLTLPLARDLARYGIRAVSIAPGMFETAMTSKLGEKARKSLLKVLEWPQRPGKAEEFALVVKAIVENPMLNGAVIRLDGATRMPSKM